MSGRRLKISWPDLITFIVAVIIATFLAKLTFGWWYANR